jgi:predicted secreted acid phosphatase
MWFSCWYSIMLSYVASDIIYTIDSTTWPCNSVIVYDIDNTLIDEDDQPINPIIHTYHYAKKKGLQTVLITARPATASTITKTKQQLQSHGLDSNLGIYFLPTGTTDLVRYKLCSRKSVHNHGYVVVISVGDMPWDIGQYGGIGFQVPKARN